MFFNLGKSVSGLNNVDTIQNNVDLCADRESLDDDVIFEVEECGGRKSSHFIRTSSQRNKRSIRVSFSGGPETGLVGWSADLK